MGDLYFTHIFHCRICQQVPTEVGRRVETSRRGVRGVTHGAALCVIRSVGQDEGLGMQGTLAVNRAESRVPTAGQDHVEMCRDGSLIPGETRDHGD